MQDSNSQPWSDPNHFVGIQICFVNFGQQVQRGNVFFVKKTQSTHSVATRKKMARSEKWARPRWTVQGGPNNTDGGGGLVMSALIFYATKCHLKKIHGASERPRPRSDPFYSVPESQLNPSEAQMKLRPHFGGPTYFNFFQQNKLHTKILQIIVQRSTMLFSFFISVCRLILVFLKTSGNVFGLSLTFPPTQKAPWPRGCGRRSSRYCCSPRRSWTVPGAPGSRPRCGVVCNHPHSPAPL